MDELKIACPSCQGHIAFPVNMHGQVIPCPHCSLSVPLVIPNYVRPPAVPRVTKGRKISDGNNGLAVVLAVVGIILMFSAVLVCWTIIPAIILMVIGASISGGKKCSECGSKTSSSAKLCPGCKCQFS